MDISTVILSFYLLMPVLYSGQSSICGALSLDKLSEAERIERTVAVGSFISYYAFSSDRIAHVDDWTFDEYDGEGVELSEELENPVYGPQGPNSELALQGLQGGSSVAERALSSREDMLRLFLYGEEQFSPTDLPDGTHSFISVNSKVVKRTLFDSEYRISEKTWWNNSKTAEDFKMLRRIRYFYRNGDDGSNAVERTQEDFFDTSKAVSTIFDERGRAAQIMYYDIQSSEEAGEKRILSKESFLAYDDNDRIVRDEQKVYKLSAEGKRLSSSSFVYEYNYGEKSEKPDLRYYEDGQLRITDVYSGANDYEESIFFDGGFSIVTFYSGRRKVLEIVYQDGTERSRRTFD